MDTAERKGYGSEPRFDPEANILMTSAQMGTCLYKFPFSIMYMLSLARENINAVPCFEKAAVSLGLKVFRYSG